MPVHVHSFTLFHTPQANNANMHNANMHTANMNANMHPMNPSSYGPATYSAYNPAYNTDSATYAANGLLAVPSLPMEQPIPSLSAISGIHRAHSHGAPGNPNGGMMMHPFQRLLGYTSSDVSHLSTVVTASTLLTVSASYLIDAAGLAQGAQDKKKKVTSSAASSTLSRQSSAGNSKSSVTTNPPLPTTALHAASTPSTTTNGATTLPTPRSRAPLAGGRDSLHKLDEHVRYFRNATSSPVVGWNGSAQPGESVGLIVASPLHAITVPCPTLPPPGALCGVGCRLFFSGERKGGIEAVMGAVGVRDDRSNPQYERSEQQGEGNDSNGGGSQLRVNLNCKGGEEKALEGGDSGNGDKQVERGGRPPRKDSFGLDAIAAASFILDSPSACAAQAKAESVATLGEFSLDSGAAANATNSTAAGSTAAGSTTVGLTAAGSTAAGSTATGSTAAGSTAAGSTAPPGTSVVASNGGEAAALPPRPPVAAAATTAPQVVMQQGVALPGVAPPKAAPGASTVAAGHKTGHSTRGAKDSSPRLNGITAEQNTLLRTPLGFSSSSSSLIPAKFRDNCLAIKTVPRHGSAAEAKMLRAMEEKKRKDDMERQADMDPYVNGLSAMVYASLSSSTRCDAVWCALLGNSILEEARGEERSEENGGKKEDGNLSDLLWDGRVIIRPPRVVRQVDPQRNTIMGSMNERNSIEGVRNVRLVKIEDATRHSSPEMTGDGMRPFAQQYEMDMGERRDCRRGVEPKLTSPAEVDLYWELLVNECSELARSIELCSLCYSSKKSASALNEQKKLMLTAGGWRRDMVQVKKTPKSTTPSNAGALPKQPGAATPSGAATTSSTAIAPSTLPPSKPARAMSWGWDGDGTASAPPTNFSPTFSSVPMQVVEMWYPPLSVARARNLPDGWHSGVLSDVWEQYILSVGDRVMDLAEKMRKVGVQGVKYRVVRTIEDDADMYDDDEDEDDEIYEEDLDDDDMDHGNEEDGRMADLQSADLAHEGEMKRVMKKLNSGGGQKVTNKNRGRVGDVSKHSKGGQVSGDPRPVTKGDCNWCAPVSAPSSEANTPICSSCKICQRLGWERRAKYRYKKGLANRGFFDVNYYDELGKHRGRSVKMFLQLTSSYVRHVIKSGGVDEHVMRMEKEERGATGQQKKKRRRSEMDQSRADEFS